MFGFEPKTASPSGINRDVKHLLPESGDQIMGGVVVILWQSLAVIMEMGVRKPDE